MPCICAVASSFRETAEHHHRDRYPISRGGVSRLYARRKPRAGCSLPASACACGARPRRSLFVWSEAGLMGKLIKSLNMNKAEMLMTGWNIAKSSKEDQDKVAVDLVASGVA